MAQIRDDSEWCRRGHSLKPKTDAHKPSVLSDLLCCPTDEEIGMAIKEFCAIHGEVPTPFAFQAGARWARAMKK